MVAGGGGLSQKDLDGLLEGCKGADANLAPSRGKKTAEGGTSRICRLHTLIV